MAHLIDSMAYTGQTPWHGLGNILPPQQSLDVWLQAAGMNWTIEQSDVLYQGAPDNPILHTYPDSKVLYRSDTLAPLSVVSQRYNVVQPHEVLHFYQDLVEVHIPVENEHLFRFKMNADSGLRVHRFRTPQCTYSDAR